MAEIGRISPTSTVLFGSPHGALRDVDPRQKHMYIMGVQLYRGYVSVKGGTMAHIQLIYGDEPQLIEEEKRKFLSAYPDLPVTVLDDEAGPQKIVKSYVKIHYLGIKRYSV